MRYSRVTNRRSDSWAFSGVGAHGVAFDEPGDFAVLGESRGDASEPRALHQGFMPDHRQRAFVWKYAESIGGKRPRHFHREPELNLVVRGSASFCIGNRVVRVSAGELLAFPAGQEHALLDASPDLYLYAVGLDAAFSREVLGVHGETVVPLHIRLAPEELEAVSDRAAGTVDRLQA